VDHAGGIVSRHHGVHRLVEGVGRPRGLELLKSVHVLRVVEASPPAERQEGASQGCMGRAAGHVQQTGAHTSGAVRYRPTLPG